MNHNIIKHILIIGLAMILGTGVVNAKKSKAAPADTVPAKTEYEKLCEASSVSEGMFKVLKNKEDYYFEIPDSLFGRDMLVVNKLVRVPEELNSAGVNRGINTVNHLIRFEMDNDANKVFVREIRPLPDVPQNNAIAKSVEDNYISPIITSFKIEAFKPDSSAVVVKATDLYNGKNTSFGDVFSEINLGTSVSGDLSKIKSVKAFDNNVYAVSELTTRVVEGGEAVYVTLEVGSSIVLLPETLMERRYVSPKVGYFSEHRLRYADDQQRVGRANYITRWRLEPKPEDKEAYLGGAVVEPENPITFYLDNSMPEQWRPYIRKGIEDWNRAFEAAGFRNAIRVKQMPDNADTDDINYSTLTYAASTKSNAMGPSIVDPRTGEIIEADIIWWHNVLDILHDWIVVQTGAVNPDARHHTLPEPLIGDAMRFVACHEVGHSLGLRHNMMASAAIPTDSLRSQSFVEKLGTSSSIMDYARFNYVAQPGDGVTTLSPQIGPYDIMAIEYGYRWSGEDDPEKDYHVIHTIFNKYQGPLYDYSEAQDTRDALDPRALSEDLGDDAIKSAKYGIANLKRIVPNIIEWSTSGETGQSYDAASNLLFGVMNQWHRYIYHVLANVGGMYLDNLTIGDGKTSYHHVPKDRQRQAVQFLIDEAFTYPEWLFDSEVTKYTYLVADTPVGRIENAPNFMLKNMQAYLMWDLLADSRIVRMYENEIVNGKDAFKAADMIDMLHKSIFGPTIAGLRPSLQERALQKNYVDALITAANENAGIKMNALRSIGDEELFNHMLHHNELECPQCNAHGESTAGRRTVNFYGAQANRLGDTISLKRGELMRVRKLLKSKIPSASGDELYHYQDLVMRINTALGFNQ